MPKIYVKHVVIGYALLLCGLLLFPGYRTAGATSYHTVSIDGTNDFAADEVFPTSSGGYTAYATWDAANLYLGFTGSDVGSGESASKWIVWYIDTDPQCGPNGGSGTPFAAPFNTQGWSQPFWADYFLQIRTDEGFNQLNSWNGAAWGATTYTGTVFDNDGTDFMELSLPRADIGNPATMRMVGYFINEQGGGEWTYASLPAASLAGGDGYKRFGTFYNWVEFDLGAGVSPNAPGNDSPPQNCTVNDNTTTWGFLAEGGTTSSGAYVSGPGTPPAGQGSARLTTPAVADGVVVGTVAFSGARLADIDSLTYSTYRAAGNPNWVSTLQLSINYDLSSATGWQGRLVYQPHLQLPSPSIPTATWQTWDTIDGGNGRWWATGAPGNATCTMGSPCTWNTIVTTWPNAGINFGTPQFLSKAGNGFAGFDGNVDNIAIAINGASYSFDLEQYLPVHNITQNTYHPTIQDGVNNALAGDEIEIDPGLYNENVTVNLSLTLRGAGAGTSPAQHTIIDGTSLNGRGIYITTGTTNVTIEELRVQNYTGTNSSGIWANGNNHNFTIQNVHAVNNGVVGASGGGVYMNGPVDGVLIDNVLAHNNRSRGIVIWNGFKTNITITNNDVRNNNCCGIELQDGTASGVTLTGNTVINNTDSGMAVIGLTSGTGPNLIANNVLTDNGRFGIEVKLANGTGLTSGDGSIVVENNTVSHTFVPADARDLVGISVYRRGWLAGNVDIPVGVVVRNNTVSGYQQTTVSDGFGIAVEGINMVVTGNTLNNNDVGVQLQAGHLPYTPFTNIDGNQANLNDTYFGRGNSPVGCATVTGNIFSGNSVNSRNVGTVGGGTVTNVDTAETFCSIQAAINDTDTLNGHTINVPVGTFVENVIINKEVTLMGAGAGSTLVHPAISNPNCGGAGGGSICPLPTPATESAIFLVQAHNVTIHGFILDGDNPNLISGVVRGGADLDARDGIITNHTVGNYNNLEVYDTTVQNIYLRGIQSSNGTFYFHSNQVRNIRGDGGSIALFNFGGGGIFEANVVDDANDGVVSNWSDGSQFLNNVVTNSSSGVHTDNSGSTVGSTADVIDGNTITDCTFYGYGVWVFAPYLDVQVQNNSVTNCDVGLAAAGSRGGSPEFRNNIITGDNSSDEAGVYVTTSLFGFGSTDVAVLFEDNQISNYTYGFYLEVDNVTYDLDVDIENNDILNNVTGFMTTGAAGNHTARVAGNTVDGHMMVFDHPLGDIQAYANNVTNFVDAGLAGAAGTFDARHNWWGVHFAQPAGVDSVSWDYRLGAAVQTWSEGNGSTTLVDSGNGGTASLGGGTGTAVIVSHGRPTTLAEAPFGNGVTGHYDVMCSDFYDLFVINSPANTWTATIPLDNSAGCLQTLTEEVIFWIPFGTDYNVECFPSNNTACWDPIDPTRVTAVGSDLEVTNLTVGELSGTPFVVGDGQQLDPTAITLSSLRTTGYGSQVVVTLALLLFTAVAFFTWALLRKQTR